MTTPQDASVFRCSFCNKSQRDVLKLIAGPTVYICNECVDVCWQILHDENIPTTRKGLNAARRNCRAAEEQLPAVQTLLDAGDFRNAARTVRDAAVTALRGVVDLTGAETHGWSEVKVITRVLQNHQELITPLQETDTTHVILRVALDGATVQQGEVEAAMKAVSEILAFLKAQIEQAEAEAQRNAGC